MATVDILLATYRGARYLPDLLASIAAQSETDWRLILRDDGSDDGGPDLVERWAAEGGHALEVVRDGVQGAGAAGSFGRLMAASDAPYFMFCDQDDVWLSGKIATCLGEARSAEADHGTALPVLVHSDLRVVDEELRETAPSFWAQQGFRTCAVPPGADGARARASLLVQNTVTGCTALGNAALREMAGPVPEAAIMHDWWVAMVAAQFGTIRAVPAPTMLYRQHGANTIGARDWGLGAVASRAVREPAAAVRRTREWLAASRAQTAAFAARYGDRLDPPARARLVEYAGLAERGILARKTFMPRHGVWPQSRVRTAIMLAIL